MSRTPLLPVALSKQHILLIGANGVCSLGLVSLAGYYEDLCARSTASAGSECSG